MQLLTKQEKLELKFLLVALTLGVFAMAYNNTLLKTGSIPKEIQQTMVFQADANSRLLKNPSASTTVHTNAEVEKSKESSQILVNINVAWKGELCKLLSIVPATAERIIG